MERSLLSQEEKKDYFFKFNVDGLLRGDYQSRMQGYAVGRQNGWMSANDIRSLENLDLIPDEEGGNLYLVNGNMTKLSETISYSDGQNSGAAASGSEKTSEEKAQRQAPGEAGKSKIQRHGGTA